MFKIFVGNLNFECLTDDLGSYFTKLGFSPSKVTIVTDRETGRSRGFAFVEFSDDGEGKKAMAAADGSEIMGRTVNCNEARPREERPRSQAGGGGQQRYQQDRGRYSDRRDVEWT